ncbi:MAG: ABC transporter permease [Defluviitaleaceae bacterium]|nr:ABC transporter permease [Defluviitaleaceae bacterium]
MESITGLFTDSWVMFKRSLTMTFRNPDAFGAAIIVPAFLMWLFGSVFGAIMDFGDYSAISFIMPGIILQTVSQGVASTAVGVNNDMAKGIIDRFRSMPISRSAVLTGHVLASVVRNIITAAIIIGVAIIMGFRSQAGVVDWLLITGVLILFMLAITWIGVVGGLLAKTPEGTTSILFILFLLPFLSTGFVPAEALSGGLRWFVANQPMSHIIDSIRALMLGTPLARNTLVLALSWCIGITVAFFALSVQIYKRKLS